MLWNRSDGFLFAPIGVCSVGDAGTGSAGGDAGGGGSEGGAGAHGSGGADDGKANGAGDDGDGGDAGSSERLTALEAENKKLAEDLRKANGESMGRRKVLESYGEVTPERARELAEMADRVEQSDREKRGEYEEQLQLERTKTATAKGETEKERDLFHGAMIERDILQAVGQLKPMEQALAPLVEGGRAQIVDATARLFRYDVEKRKTYHVSETNEKGEPMEAREFFSKHRAGKLAIFFASGRKAGAGADEGEPLEGDDAKIVKISRSWPSKRRVAAYEEAKKAGKTPVLVGEETSTSSVVVE